eukprot:gene16159-21420_t
MIRLFGRSNSIAVQKVMWTAAELNLLNVERIDAGGKFGLPDNYLSVNPNGKVPTIIDSNGFSLWESHAICKYLIRKYAGNLSFTAICPVALWYDTSFRGIILPTISAIALIIVVLYGLSAFASFCIG